MDIQFIEKHIESIIRRLKWLKNQSMSLLMNITQFRNAISDDVEEVEQSLEKLDIQPSSSENPQEEEVKEDSSSQQNANEGLPKE